MPWLPITNWVKNVVLKPTKTSTAAIRPHASLYIRPVIFGHQ